MSEQLSISGIITEIFEEKQITEKFKKREFVIKTPGEYGQDILMQFVQDKTSILNSYSIGQNVNCKFNLKGRGYEKDGAKRYFTTVECWFIEVGSGQSDAQPTNDMPY